METQIKRKEKGPCDIVGCENEATVRGQTLRFCYEHYCKITANDGSDSTIKNEEFFVGSHKLTKHFNKVEDDHLLDMICGSSEVCIEGELLKEFEAVKKHFGIKEDINVIRKLVADASEDIPRIKRK